jgi:hypothetical protein
MEPDDLSMKSHPKNTSMVKENKGRYPETNGSKAAAKARKMANSLSDEKREEHLQKALAIIYGSGSKKSS